jgi:hypothetical protein
VTAFVATETVPVTVSTVALVVDATAAVVFVTVAVTALAVSVTVFVAAALETGAVTVLAVSVTVFVAAAGALETGAVTVLAVSVTVFVAVAGAPVTVAVADWVGAAGCAGVPGRPACAMSAKAAAPTTVAATISRRRIRVRAREITMFWFPISKRHNAATPVLERKRPQFPAMRQL